jgi:hypothetical protein
MGFDENFDDLDARGEPGFVGLPFASFAVDFENVQSSIFVSQRFDNF